MESHLKDFGKKKKDLTIGCGLEEIGRETYDLTLQHFNDQMQVIYQEINTFPRKISNLEKLLSISLKKLK